MRINLSLLMIVCGALKRLYAVQEIRRILLWLVL